MYYIYILRCRDGTLYTGITPELKRRMAAHMAGTGAKYTRSHPPVELAAVWKTAEKNDALRLEWAVKKRLNRAEKLRLIADPARIEGLVAEPERFIYAPGVTLENCGG